MKAISIEELITIFESSDFEEDPSISIVRHSIDDRDLRFDIKLTDDYDPLKQQDWEIVCKDVVGFQIHANAHTTSGQFFHKKQHPLLWEFLEPQVDLYFTGNCASSQELIGALYQKHLKLTDGWIPFAQFFNMANDPIQLFRGSAGKLAGGPKCLLNGYSQVLAAAGLVTSFSKERRPVHWDETHQWVEQRSDLSIVGIGSSYFVAREFKAHRLEESGREN
jgi:hypothetical protein